MLFFLFCIKVANKHLEKYNGKNVVYVVLKVLPGPATPYYYSSDGVQEAYVRSGNQGIKAPRYILEEIQYLQIYLQVCIL